MRVRACGRAGVGPDEKQGYIRVGCTPLGEHAARVQGGGRGVGVGGRGCGGWVEGALRGGEGYVYHTHPIYSKLYYTHPIYYKLYYTRPIYSKLYYTPYHPLSLLHFLLQS